MIEPGPAPLRAEKVRARAGRELAIAGAAALALLLASVLAGSTIGPRAGYPLSRVGAPLVVAAVLLTPYFALSGRAFRESLAARFRAARPLTRAGPGALLAGALLLPATLAAILGLAPAGPSWPGPLRLLAYVAAPLVLLATARRDARPGFREAAAILLLWLPLELDLLRGSWSDPPEPWEPILNVLVATSAGVFLFAVVRGLEGLDYAFRPDRRAWAWGVGAFLAATPFLLLGGLASGFLRPRGHPGDPGTIVASFVVVFLFNALPEELLFRGLIQNSLTRWFGRFVPALVVSSLVFGLSHVNNGSEPNWRFAALATIAGLFYGMAYRRGGGVTAAALAHTLVNVGLHTFFRYR